MSGKYGETLIIELLNSFPEFEKSEERRDLFDEDGPYIYFSYFGEYILKEINKNKNSKLIIRFFDFINKYFESENLSATTWDLFNIEFFFRLHLKKEYEEIANQYLKGKALLAFSEKKGRPSNDKQ